MKIKNACKPPVVFSAYTIVYFFLWVPVSLILLTGLNNKLLASGIVAIGIIPLIYCFKWDRAKSGRKFSEYIEELRNGFSCPECNTVIPECVEYDRRYDLPVLFYCEQCDTLWYTGMHNNQSA